MLRQCFSCNDIYVLNVDAYDTLEKRKISISWKSLSLYFYVHIVSKIDDELDFAVDNFLDERPME